MFSARLESCETNAWPIFSRGCRAVSAVLLTSMDVDVLMSRSVGCLVSEVLFEE